MVTCEQPILFELYGFSDASEMAYGACVYLKYVNTNNESEINLQIGKSKVAPLRTITIPRIELIAALILANY